ncbi:MAG: sialate O-acetylesterase, partial [Phycisphaeraceae bacterium]|nr:sialate O-acetylesterase [Phycisphaeraceae bacterium]
MKIWPKTVSYLVLSLVTLLCLSPGAAWAGDSKKLKIYILAGQSNMEGHASIGTFDYVGMDPKTRPLLEKMRGEDGNPAVADRVWITYYTGRHNGTPHEVHGKLTAGYGAIGPRKEPGDKIGPEYLFGLKMQEHYDGPILIIKTAWGGKSLNTDFRPPSAGPYEFPQATLDKWAKRPEGAHGIPAQDKIPGRLKEIRERSGHYYRLMADHVKKVLADPGRVCPAYDPKAGYEVAGFVWFQGWNDMVDGNTYPDKNQPDGYREYTRLLACLIRDVRKLADAPDMKAVVGVLGVGGEEADGPIAHLRLAMKAITEVDDLKADVAAVPTAPFWDEKMASLQSKRGEVGRVLQSAYLTGEDGRKHVALPDDQPWQPIGKPAPEQREWRYFTFDPLREEDKLKPKQNRRFRDVQRPEGVEGWTEPGFDDSNWATGRAPIGTGEWKERGGPTVWYATEWGGEEFIMMRSTFEIDDPAQLDLAAYRLVILNKQGFRVYLNGEQIARYIWWQDTRYRPMRLSEKHAGLLRKGK